MGTNQCRFSQNTLKNRLESGDFMISDERGSGKTDRKTAIPAPKKNAECIREMVPRTGKFLKKNID